MLKKHKKIVAFIFLASLIFVTVYGNYHFFKDQIFAEMTEESVTTESSQTSSGERSSQDDSEGKNPSIELEGEAVEPQQVEKITRGVLDAGWEAGTANDFIEQQGNKISWNQGNWWYTYNNSSWIYGSIIEATLIVNDKFLPGTNENTRNGFLWANLAESVYTKNLSANTLKRSFPYKSYQIEILQKMLDDGAIEVSYQVTNRDSTAQKIGVSQYVDILDSSPIQVLNGFKGLNVTATNSVALMPDSETMPNWSTGNYGRLKDFSGYSPKTIDGIGWESGKKQPDSSIELKENKPMNLGDSGAVMKNPGVMVEPNE